MEDLFVRLQNFLDQEAENFETPEAAIQHFMETYNASLKDGKSDYMMSPKIEAMDLYQLAMEEDDLDKYMKLLKEAHALDPDNLDIQAKIVLEENDDHEAYDILRDLADSYFKAHQKDIRDGDYANVANRPYFRLKRDLTSYYLDELRFVDAESQAKDILKYNKNDNLGIRYILMSLYVQSYQYKKVRSFFKSQAYHRDDDQMVFYLITSLVLEGDFAYARQEIARLAEMNPEIYDFFLEEEFDIQAVEENLPGPMGYRPGSGESLALVFYELLSLYGASDFLYYFIRKTLIEISPQVFKKSRGLDLNLDATLLHFVEEVVAHFKGIQPQYVNKLVASGYVRKEDFEKVTRDEILSLPGIGEVTVQKLEANGIRFKKPSPDKVIQLDHWNKNQAGD